MSELEPATDSPKARRRRRPRPSSNGTKNKAKPPHDAEDTKNLRRLSVALRPLDGTAADSAECLRKLEAERDGSAREIMRLHDIFRRVNARIQRSTDAGQSAKLEVQRMRVTGQLQATRQKLAGQSHVIVSHRRGRAYLGIPDTVTQGMGVGKAIVGKEATGEQSAHPLYVYGHSKRTLDAVDVQFVAPTGTVCEWGLERRHCQGQRRRHGHRRGR